MERLLADLLVLLATGRPIASQLVQIALEGYTVQFCQDGDTSRMVVTLIFDKGPGARTTVSQMLDMDLILDPS